MNTGKHGGGQQDENPCGHPRDSVPAVQRLWCECGVVVFMKIRLSKEPLPRVWSTLGKGILHEDDIPGVHGSRLFCKLLVFDSSRNMTAFYRNYLGRKDNLTKDCLGYVNSLSYGIYAGEKRVAWQVDPRYFAVMCLLKGHSTAEVLAHECVHAAFAFAKRVRSRSHWTNAFDFDEEHVAYPAGHMVNYVAWSLKRAGL